MSISWLTKYVYAILFLISLIVFFLGSPAIIKKLLLLEIISIIILGITIMTIDQEIIRMDFLLILLTFLVIDAVLGLRLLVTIRRKSTNFIKIDKAYWLCS